ncbi:MAG: hypothetical protein QNJ12_18330 [Ilumatobacter sp.]|uniref:hypothetical protein n=1 Tax=Ilumatobacter sp. TaxID=1967498 RepID=UPI00261FF9E3|nr:hypothetical protein [Ilumatobacter sp.]MDJ0770757.1 hypothetical protein [Ilumatobacter sp.]
MLPDGPVGVSTPIRLRTFAVWFAGIAAVVGLAGVAIRAAGAPSDDRAGPDEVRLAQMQSIDALAADRDCLAIRAQTNEVVRDIGIPGTEQHSRNVLIIQYADDALQRLGCQFSTSIESGVIGPFAGSSRTARF